MAIGHAVRVECNRVITKNGPESYRIKQKLKDHRRSQGHKKSKHKSPQGHKIVQVHESSQESKGSKGHFPK